MTTERRNDVGSKILVAVVSILLGIILTISWSTAREAMTTANHNKLEVSVLKSDFANLKDIMNEIKADVKEIKKLVK